jgi:uncharacterized protein with PCYCGC motif
MSSTRARLAPPLVIVATAALVLAGCSEQAAEQTPAQAPPTAQAAPAATPAARPAAVPAATPDPRPPAAASEPGAQEDRKPIEIPDSKLPPLPVTSFPAARPMDVVNAVFKFAARRPDVLSKVPCFCGCERMGHRGNDDCFVKSRDARGVPTEWEEHGLG